MVRVTQAKPKSAQNRESPPDWLNKLLSRRNPNVVAVALAHKNARIVWALLSQDRQYQPDYAAA